jgi:hypothetical protein
VDILVLLHYDYKDDRGQVKNLLPIDDIINYAKNNKLWIVEVFSKNPVTSFDSIIDTEVFSWIDSESSYLFNDCNIILTGGYRSLCFKHAYESLSTNNNVIINPDWVISDPDYINNNLFPFWVYPENILKA